MTSHTPAKRAPNSTAVAPVAIITGAGSGIGRATAIALAQSGHNVVLVGRRIGVLEETLQLLPERASGVCVSADLGDSEQAASIVEAALERFGRVDVIVNNAALAPLKPIDETPVDLIEEVYSVNAIGPACVIAAAWPVFKKQYAQAPSAGAGACIVNVSTLGTLDPFPGFFAYAASKAAMNLMAKSCAAEGRPFGIRAFAVAPGAVETEMLRAIFSAEVLPSDKCLSAERVAEEIVACVNGERDAHNGRIIYMSAERGTMVMG